MAETWRQPWRHEVEWSGRACGCAHGASGRSPESPTLELRLKPTTSPVHDKASRKPVRISRRSGGTRQCRTRIVEFGRANSVDRTVVEIVSAPEGIGKLRDRAAQKVFQISS